MSLLNQCNLHCFYCRPPGHRGVFDHVVPSLDRLQAAISLLCDAKINKVRFTGGEPTISSHLQNLITFTRNSTPVEHIALTSNGILLEQSAKQLAEAGLNSVNISLDTLNREKFNKITSVDGLKQVIAGIEAAITAVPSVKLNCVLLRGINDDEAGSMITFADALGVPLRFIEYMPSTLYPRNNGWYISTEDVKKRLPYDFSPIDPVDGSAARYYRAPNLSVPIGFISPVSNPFCGTCNRLRLAADGRLYHCLFSKNAINLFELLDQDRHNGLHEVREFIKTKPTGGAKIRCSGSLPSFIEMGG